MISGLMGVTWYKYSDVRGRLQNNMHMFQRVLGSCRFVCFVTLLLGCLQFKFIND